MIGRLSMESLDLQRFYSVLQQTCRYPVHMEQQLNQFLVNG